MVCLVDSKKVTVLLILKPVACEVMLTELGQFGASLYAFGQPSSTFLWLTVIIAYWNVIDEHFSIPLSVYIKYNYKWAI